MNVIASSRTIAFVGTALVGTALLTSCGSTTTPDDPFLDQSPRAITRTAMAAMDDVTSVRLLGTLHTDRGRVRIDVRVDDGGRCAGSFDGDRGGARFVSSDDGTWAQPDETFWRTSTATSREAEKVMREVGTSWVSLADGAVDVDELCGTKAILGGFKGRKDGGEGRLSKGDVELVGDTQAVAVRAKGRGQAATMWVEVEEPHRVVKIISRDHGRPQSISFEEFGTEVTAEAPPADEVLDMTAYGAGGTPRR
ncbi:hypothetical protein [Nocardioides currus]|uniref:Lipoprotein n=1 Tax=Nocardioides currus TaxID=2133958 RepID=A0A2R7Z2R6_9ACTN|nr:hypothetical protein [Nocardioides currus]PUA82925.1 hypothetical protein C7S10_04315 [Nocardioides currus]